MSLGSRTNRRPHIRLVLIRHSRPCLIHNGCSTDISSGTHVNTVTSYGDQRTGGGRIIIDKSIYRYRTVQNKGTYRICMNDSSSVCIHMQYYSLRIMIYSFFITALHIPPRSTPDLFFNIDLIIQRFFTGISYLNVSK